MNETTVIVAFFIQPTDTLGGQAEEVIDVASTERYENLLRKELNLPDASVRLFREGTWDMPSIATRQALDISETFTQFVGHAAIALDKLQVADEVVEAFAKAQFEVLSLPTSGRVVLFQAIIAPKSSLGGLVEAAGSSDEAAQPKSSRSKLSDPAELKNYLAVLDGSKQAADAVLEGLRLDPNDSGCVAILATASARYLSLYPGRAIVEMNKAWTENVEKFMFSQCKRYSKGLKLTMDDPRKSIQKLTVRLAFATFETNTLDADAAAEIDFVIQTLEEEGGGTLNRELDELRQKLQKERDRFCFVATVVYGSGDAAEVVLLRAFRDKWLVRFRLGRLFVARYYEYGPSIAAFVRPRKRLRRVIRALLDIALLPVSARDR